MLRFLPAVFLIGFLVEIAAIIAVGRQIGILATLALLVAGALIGATVIRSAGLGMASLLQRPDASRSFGSHEAAAGFLYFVAGLLFAVPGFVSDAIAIILLPAPVRRAVAAWMMRRVKGTVHVHAETWRSDRHRGPVIEGDAVEIEGEIADRRSPGDRR